MKLFEGFKKYLKDIEDIAAIEKQAKLKGRLEVLDETTELNYRQIKQMEKITLDGIEASKRQREEYDKAIEDIINKQKASCKACKNTIENQRNILQTRQSYLAKIITDMEHLWQRMYQHNDEILGAAAEMVRYGSIVSAARGKLLDYRREFDEIIKQAEPLLNIQLTDETTFKLLEQGSDGVKMIDDRSK